MATSKLINFVLTVSSLIGLGVSIYAFVVEIAIEHNRTYAPMCDISETVSCTKAFKSKYGKGFGLLDENSALNKPNGLLGIIYYSLLTIIVKKNSSFWVKVSSLGIILSNIASVYLGYVLYFELGTLCVVCVSLYIVNLINLIAIFYKQKLLSAPGNYKAE